MNQEPLESKRYLFQGLFAAALIELATIFCRYGLGWKSSVQTSALAPLTFGLRIHHGYVGLLILGLVIPAKKYLPEKLFGPLVILGLGMFLSDLVHHFGVLWYVEGSPEFDLLYPKNH